MDNKLSELSSAPKVELEQRKEMRGSNRKSNAHYTLDLFYLWLLGSESVVCCMAYRVVKVLTDCV